MHLFWRKGRKMRSNERFKTSSIVNARFRESYFKLKVNGRAVSFWHLRTLSKNRTNKGRAVTSQTDKQPNVEVGSVWVCTGQPTWTISSSNLQGWNSFSVVGHLFISPLLYFIFLELCLVRGVSVFFVVFSFHNRLDLIREPAFYWVFYFILFSKFSLVCFIIRNDEKVLFVLVQ